MRSHLLLSFAGLLLTACGAPEVADPAVTVEAEVTQESEPPAESPATETADAPQDDVIIAEVPPVSIATPFHSLECAPTDAWDATMPCVDGGECDVVLLQGECGLTVGAPPVLCFANTAAGWLPCADAVALVEGSVPADLNARIEASLGIALADQPHMIPAVEACMIVEGILPSHPADLTSNGIAFDLGMAHHTACVDPEKPFSWGGAPGQGTVTIDIDRTRPGCEAALADLPVGISLTTDEHGDVLAASHFGLAAIASGSLEDLL